MIAIQNGRHEVDVVLGIGRRPVFGEVRAGLARPGGRGHDAQHHVDALAVRVRDDDIEDGPVDFAPGFFHHFPADLLFDPVQVKLVLNDVHPVGIDVVAFLYLDPEVEGRALDEAQGGRRCGFGGVGAGGGWLLRHSGRGGGGLLGHNLHLWDWGGLGGGQRGGGGDLRRTHDCRVTTIRQQHAGCEKDRHKGGKPDHQRDRAPDQGERPHLAAFSLRFDGRGFHRHSQRHSFLANRVGWGKRGTDQPVPR